MEPEVLHLVATDWTFLSEGGAHIVILCNNSENVCFGSVLRIPKGKRMENDQCSNLNYHMMNVAFVSNSMKRWFKAETLVNSKLVSLSTFFTSEILSSIERMRYEGRRDSNIILLPFGYLESNLLKLDISNVSKSFSFEIKVKCGLSSCSPLLHPMCQAKLRYHRYEIMQQYKVYKNVMSLKQMPWGVFTSLSTYNPRDLCSREPDRVRKAISALFDNPQNNLGIKYNNQHIFGWNENDSLKLIDCLIDSLKGYLLREQEVPVNSSETAYTLLDLYKNMMADLLIKSPQLHKLEILQALDILDTEGMERVYKRGIILSNQSLEVFETALLDYLAHHEMDVEEIRALGSFLLGECSIDILPLYDCSSHFTNVTSKIIELVNLRINLGFDIHERERRRDRAIELINQLDLQEVFYLLYIQMLSMISKDCSLIITMSPILTASCDSMKTLEEIMKPKTPSSGIEIEFPANSDNFSSIGWIFPFGKDHPLSFHFHMKWIDIGLKPLSKLHHKHQKEKKICNLLFGESHD